VREQKGRERERKKERKRERDERAKLTLNNESLINKVIQFMMAALAARSSQEFTFQCFPLQNFLLW
jgi:hypothetical protein